MRASCAMSPWRWATPGWRSSARPWKSWQPAAIPWSRSMQAGRWTNYHRIVKLWIVAGMAAVSMWAQQSPVESGYDHFYNLEYGPSIADFEKAIAQHPDVPDLHNHLAQ